MYFVLSRFVDVRREEVTTLLWSMAWFFSLLMGYFAIRPVRETMGVEDAAILPWLFFGTFICMLLAAPIYAGLVARFRRRLLVPIVYRFFAVCLLGFWYSFVRGNTWTINILGAELNGLNVLFFIFVSVYNMFVVSIFWSFMADVYKSQQAKRLFGVISAGGTLGAALGSATTGIFVKQLGIANLFLIAAASIELSIFFMGRVHNSAKVATVPDSETVHEVETTQESEKADEATGGSMLEGIQAVFQSKYLLSICAFVLIAKMCVTTGYYQQADIVKAAIPDQQSRTELFARMSLFGQILTFMMQTFIVGRLMRWIGVAATLCIFPAVCLLGFTGLGLASILPMLVVMRVAQRSVAFGIGTPTQEVLFTAVPREQKYKSKNFIDTVVIRGGDVASGFIFRGIQSLGFSISSIAWMMVPLSGIWCLLAWFLGRQQAHRSANNGTIVG